ncbi:hypothetical protein SLA2020_176840 [Shorea laevis]
MLLLHCDLSAPAQFGFSPVSLVGGLSLEVLCCFAQLASLNCLVPLYGAVFQLTKGEVDDMFFKQSLLLGGCTASGRSSPVLLSPFCRISSGCFGVLFLFLLCSSAIFPLPVRALCPGLLYGSFI